MKYEDLSFTKINEDGIEMICDILAVVPNPDNKEEPYVIYTDYTLDDKDEFVNSYGKIVSENDEYTLKTVTDKKTIDLINKESEDEIVKYVNKEIQDNIE